MRYYLAILLFVPFSLVGQRKGHPFVEYRSGQLSLLCTTSIAFYADSTYEYEHGCEGRSYISFGKFKSKEDVITLLPIEADSIQVIKKITFFKLLDSKDSESSLKIVDFKNNPVRSTGVLVRLKLGSAAAREVNISASDSSSLMITISTDDDGIIKLDEVFLQSIDYLQ